MPVTIAGIRTLVYLGLCILPAAVLLLMVTASRADQPPATVSGYLPILQAQQRGYWPDVPQAAMLGAVIERERVSRCGISRVGSRARAVTAAECRVLRMFCEYADQGLILFAVLKPVREI